jgi:hypothetical protein
MSTPPDRDQEVLIATEWDLGGLVRVAATVGPDGRTDLWLLVPDATEGRWQIPSHEWVGPLPEPWRHRLDITHTAPSQEGTR